MAEQLFTNLADEGLAEASITKLKSLLPDAEKGASYLSQTYGLSFDDGTRLALAINLLSNLPIPSKLLNIRPLRSQQQTRSNYDNNQNSNLSSFNQPYNPYAPYSMYQYQQAPYLGSAGTIVNSTPGYSQTTLFVRNLPNSTTEEEILSVFQNYGAIKEARFQKNKETQQFSGSVFLEYIHPSAARLAQVQLNEKLWGERLIHIDFAKERLAGREDRQADQVTRQPSNSLYVSNLPPECDKTMLIQIFSRFGTILDARPLKKEDGNMKGIAFIDFALQESAAAAIDALDGSSYGTRTIKVAYAANPSKRKGDELGEDPETKRFRGEGGFTGVPMYYDPSQMGYSNVGDQSQQWYGQGYY